MIPCKYCSVLWPAYVFDQGRYASVVTLSCPSPAPPSLVPGPPSDLASDCNVWGHYFRIMYIHSSVSHVCFTPCLCPCSQSDTSPLPSPLSLFPLFPMRPLPSPSPALSPLVPYATPLFPPPPRSLCNPCSPLPLFFPMRPPPPCSLCDPHPPPCSPLPPWFPIRPPVPPVPPSPPCSGKCSSAWNFVVKCASEGKCASVWNPKCVSEGFAGFRQEFL